MTLCLPDTNIFVRVHILSMHLKKLKRTLSVSFRVAERKVKSLGINTISHLLTSALIIRLSANCWVNAEPSSAGVGGREKILLSCLPDVKML